MYKGYLIDLDGTAYHGTKVVKETLEFVKALHEKQISYLFLTNNSTKTPQMVADVLADLGYPVTEQQVYTPSMATAQYIYDENPNAKVYMIGEIGLETALVEKGLTITSENPDYVVIGLDRDINYEKLGLACLAIRNGATFISTNGDVAIPTERGLLPGNGALTSVISVSTGVDPIFIGKPERIIMEKALELIRELGSPLGILQKTTKGNLEEEIEALIAERQQARKDRNFALADKIRDDLKGRGIELLDTPQGVRWKKVD